MKVQVNLSEDLVARIDKFAKLMGVSRSALCGVWIGQAVMSMEKTFETGQRVVEDLFRSVANNGGSDTVCDSDNVDGVVINAEFND